MNGDDGMNSKYKSLSDPEVYFRDCFKKNKAVCCHDTVFIQNNTDVTDEVYTHIFPSQREANDKKDSFFGVGLIIPDNPESIVSDVRSRISKGVKSIPTDRFILPNMDVAICRIIRYVQFNVAFEDLIISYVYDGEYTITFDDKKYELKKGNAIIIAPNVPYSAIIDNDDTVVFNLLIRVSTFATAFLNLITENDYLSKFLINMLFSKEQSPYTIVQTPPDDKLCEILLKLFELREKGITSATMNNTLTQLFICNLFYSNEECIQNKNLFSRNDILAADIVSYLHKNYLTVSLQDVSDRFSLSARHLSRILKGSVGMNYMSIITDIKIEKAKAFLKCTDLSIDEICTIVGYSDSRQLRFIFKQKYGISPGEYRRKIKSTGVHF